MVKEEKLKTMKKYSDIDVRLVCTILQELREAVERCSNEKRFKEGKFSMRFSSVFNEKATGIFSANPPKYCGINFDEGEDKTKLISTRLDTVSGLDDILLVRATFGFPGASWLGEFQMGQKKSIFIHDLPSRDFLNEHPNFPQTILARKGAFGSWKEPLAEFIALVSHAINENISFLKKEEA